jgi:hypothetical protein
MEYIVAQQFPMNITAGIPYGKLVTVTLPSGRVWWTSGSQFEVLFQLREGPDVNSALISDLRQYLTVTYTGPNTVSIAFDMTGEDTRTLTKSGYYDMIISDVGVVDNRAFIVLSGVVYLTSTVTDSVEAST